MCAILSMALVAIGCSGEVYTLYRTSVVPGITRIHVATFDATEGGAYNKETCEIARGLFQRQPGVVVLYFCEKGRAVQTVE
jgi:hypothetical protein